MSNLFKKAKSAAPAKKAAAEREVFPIDSSVLETEICALAKLNKQIAELSAEAKLLTKSVKDQGFDKFVEVYDDRGKFPGSMTIKSGNGEFMFVPMDKYLSIDKDAAAEISAISPELVTEKTTYTMNTKLVEKYGDVISEMIEKSKKITADDKEKLIGATVKYEITKGTIKSLKDDYAGTPVAEMLEIIQPVYMMKGLKDVSETES